MCVGEPRNGTDDVQRRGLLALPCESFLLALAGSTAHERDNHRKEENDVRMQPSSGSASMSSR
jgi:hypothetical protein